MNLLSSGQTLGVKAIRMCLESRTSISEIPWVVVLWFLFLISMITSQLQKFNILQSRKYPSSVSSEQTRLKRRLGVCKQNTVRYSSNNNNNSNSSSQQFPSSWDQSNQQNWQGSQIVQEDVLDDWIETPYEGPRGIGQKILALALAALLTGSLLNIFWRLFVIGYVLLSAAFKYSVVAILVVVIALFIA
eukprot:TRINITY_DN15599_c0_g2_i1.p2 TRINITY_DN15599_c0_g2~~TRINITY_DN15599_c0_g2_i1.p2  ORF type:complete len:189 (-),score=8.13 TRINITY_DN15599_c0_g2_i1:989-1555(-)